MKLYITTLLVITLIISGVNGCVEKREAKAYLASVKQELVVRND